MKSIRLCLLLMGLLCWASCTPEDTATDVGQTSDTAVQTKTQQPIPQEKTPQPQPAVEQPAKPLPAENPTVKLATTKGYIIIKLYADKAPITVENFLNYVRTGHYDGTVFHRVIGGFMIQGGGLTADLRPKPTQPPIKNESSNKLRNRRGTVAMARRNQPDSATSQFFINLVDNRSLDFDGPMAPGYAVFGQVVEGMDVVDAIAAVPTRRVGPHGNVPTDPVVIESASVLK